MARYNMARGRHLQHVASSTAQQFAPRLQRLVLHAVRRLHHLRRPGTLGGATRARLCPPHSKATGCSKHGWFATTFRASAAAVRAVQRAALGSACGRVQRARSRPARAHSAAPAGSSFHESPARLRLHCPASRRARTAAPAAAFALRGAHTPPPRFGCSAVRPPRRHVPQRAFAFAAPAVPGGRGARRARPARRDVLLARRRPRLRPRACAPRARPSRI